MSVLGIIYLIGAILMSVSTSRKCESSVVNLISSIIMGILWPIVIMLVICMKVSRWVENKHREYKR